MKTGENLNMVERIVVQVSKRDCKIDELVRTFRIPKDKLRLLLKIAEELGLIKLKDDTVVIDRFGRELLSI